MKTAELQKIIREEVSKALKESKSPIDHKVSGDYIILQFRDEKECQEAKQYYSKLNVRTTPDKKGLTMPVESVIRFLVNSLQNKSYNKTNI